MSDFKNNPEGFKALRKKLLVFLTLFFLVIIAGLVIFPEIRKAQSDATTLLVTSAFLLIVFGYTTWNTLRQQRKIYYSYQLTLAADKVSRRQSNMPELTLLYHQIKGIEQVKNGSLLIRGTKPTELICVSRHIENYEHIKSELNLIKPISEYQPQNILLKYPYIPPILMMALMITFYVFDDKITSTITGTLTIGILIWSFYKIRVNKNLDAKLRSNSWWMIVIILSILVMMYNRFTTHP